MSAFVVECPCPCGVRFPVDSETMRKVNYLHKVEITDRILEPAPTRRVSLVDEYTLGDWPEGPDAA